MRIVYDDEYDGWQNRIRELEAELDEYRQLGPLIGLARLLQQEVVETLEDHPDYTTQRIGELAYRAAMDAQLAKASDTLVAEYETEHRAELYQKALDEVRSSEGAAIFEEVRRKLDADPEIMMELRTSARKELAARAKDTRRQVITAEQQEIVNEEAERQLLLDGFDVRLALDGQLDLTNQELLQLLQPNDYVDIFCTPEGLTARQKITLMWVQDARGNLGWRYLADKQKVYTPGGSQLSVPQDVFVTIGSVGRDMNKAKDIHLDNKLVIGRPLTLAHPANVAKSGRYNPYVSLNPGRTYPEVKPAVIAGTDFRTRDLLLLSGSSA